MILMISTTTLQPPTNDLFIFVSLHVSNVVESMFLIISRNPVIKPVLCRTRLRFKRRGILDQVMDAVVEDIFVVAKIHQDCRNYEMNKVGGANTALLVIGGNHCFDGIWMAYYGKCNTWSGTPNDHTTDFQYVTLLVWLNYHLPTNHPFHHH